MPSRSGVRNLEPEVAARRAALIVAISARIRRLPGEGTRNDSTQHAGGVTWLEAYEKILNRMLQLQQQAAAATQIEWINAVATANADFMREMSNVYFQTAREQLK